MRTIEYNPEIPVIRMIDQRRLPGTFTILKLENLEDVLHAIKDMAVRGAPAIGITAAFGLALVGRLNLDRTEAAWRNHLENAGNQLLEARPTAVNLRWAVDRTLKFSQTLKDDPLPAAQGKLDTYVQALADDDVETNRRMAAYGAKLLEDGSTVIHHCNTGSLAAVDYGTALGVIRYAHESGKKIHVLVDETRPRLQGARLTVWELDQYGIPYDLICDNAAGYFLQHEQVQAVLVGADRVAANGDVANKIGTYMLALAAHDTGVPFYCVAPRSTFDPHIQSGDEIPIEQRPESEILTIQLGSQSVVPTAASARNPAFDITPHRLVSSFITDAGIISPPYRESIKSLLQGDEI
jgi:methylthioribose-1-phosphate isomerase